jgi:hypothetical protein
MSDAAALRRPERRHLAPPTAAEAASARIVGMSATALMALFFMALMLPIEPRLGPIRMTPYNALQIVLFIPLLLRFRNDPSNRIVPLDLFMVLHVLMMAVAIYYHHGLERGVYIVNQTVTVFGGYLIGRVMIRSAADYRRFFACFFWSLLIFLPFAIYELLTKTMLVSDLLGRITQVHPRAGQPPRLGLFRVQGFTEHSILFGLYCSIGVANFFYIWRDEPVKRLTRTGLAGLMTFMSLSSAPVIALGIQLLLIAWDRTLQIFAYRWYVLVISSAFILAVFQLGYENGIIGLVIDNLLFDAKTGWGRTEVFEYGAAEVLRHPMLGIGLNDWVRPWWRKPSVDNYYLATAMRFGLPALLAFCLGLAVHGQRIMRQRRLSDIAASYRRGYLLAWVGLIFVLATVNVWGAVSVMVMVYLGAGAWFYAGDAGEAPEPVRHRRSGDRNTVARRRSGRAATVSGATARGARPVSRRERHPMKQDRPGE